MIFRLWDPSRLCRTQKLASRLKESASCSPMTFCSQLNALYGAVLSNLGEDELAHKTLQTAHQLNARDRAVGDILFIATIMVARKRQAAEDYPDALCYYQDAAKPKASGAGASSWHSGNLFTDGPIGAGSNRERNS